MNMPTNLDDIALFVEIARQMSFSKASEKLNMPASTLSRRFAAFERSLGLKLIHRTTRSLHLTEVGVRYYDRCRAILQELSLLHDEVKEQTQSVAGLIRLSTAADFGVFYLAPVIDAFSKRHPEVQFDIDLSATMVALDKDHFDTAIRMGPLENSGLIAKYLGTVTIKLYASAAYITRYGLPQTPKMLTDHQCLGLLNQPHNQLWILHNANQTEIIEQQTRLRMNNLAMLQYFIEVGHGIGALPATMVEEHVAQARLIPVLPQWQFEPVPVHAVFTHRNVPMRVRKFIEFLTLHLNL